MNRITACVFLAALISMIGAVWFGRLRFSFSNIITIRLRLKDNATMRLFLGWPNALGGVVGIAALMLLAPHLSAFKILGGLTFALGLNTLNWLWPATGAVTPTAAQVANQDSVIVDVTTDGVLTTQTFTHNLNISAADITAGWPDITWEAGGATGIPATLLLLITRPVTANAVILTFAAVVATFRLKIKRPHSIGR
jgi:hypothetical protein